MSANSLPVRIALISGKGTAVWHTLAVNQGLSLLNSNADSGLTPEEVQQHWQKYGDNELKESNGRSSGEILLDQFKNMMLLMLIAVALISGFLDLMAWQAGELDPGEVPFKGTIAIMAIVILNGVLGYIQETRAEKALASES